MNMIEMATSQSKDGIDTKINQSTSCGLAAISAFEHDNLLDNPRVDLLRSNANYVPSYNIFNYLYFNFNLTLKPKQYVKFCEHVVRLIVHTQKSFSQACIQMGLDAPRKNCFQKVRNGSLLRRLLSPNHTITK